MEILAIVLLVPSFVTNLLSLLAMYISFISVCTKGYYLIVHATFLNELLCSCYTTGKGWPMFINVTVFHMSTAFIPV